jgi:signal transduction histidine kinase
MFKSLGLSLARLHELSGPWIADMTTDRPETKHGVADFLPIIAAVSAGLALSILVFLVVRGYYAGADRQLFQRNATYYGTTFKSNVERHVTSLAAIHAFVSASHDVNRWEFSAFAHQILPQNSGFKAVLWLPQIAQEERKAFESRLQNDGLYGLRLRELVQSGQLVDAESRPTYLPVAYVEPFEGNGGLIGVDLSNNDIYSPLFRAARQTGEAVVSAPLPHVLVEGAKEPVVLVVFPLSRHGGPGGRGSPGAPEGYALGVLELDRVIEDSIGSHAPVQGAIAYGPKNAPAVFLTGQHEKTTDLNSWIGDSPFHQVVPFSVAGRHFLLVLRSVAHDDILTRVYAPTGAALLVIALTALLAQSMASTTLRKRTVERAVIERTAELRDLNRILNVEIEQRRHAEAALRVAKNKAEAANHAKSAFLSTMSHELRTPLNAIIGFSSILADTQTADERTRDYSREINGSGTKLLDLINDILEITQMDTQNNDTRDLIFVPDITDAAIAKMQSLADKAGISLQSSVPNDLPPLRGDSKRVQKALVNLLSNAIKFTEYGGWARVTAHADASGLILEVRDNGVGMPPNAERKVIGLFSQFDSSLSRGHEGVGLGLTFVQRVADCHGAALEMSSNLGDGTLVRLCFPPDRIVKAAEVA